MSIAVMGPSVRKFRARVTRTGARVEVRIPFDPAEAWGPRARYHVTGTIEGDCFRATLVLRDGAWLIQRGPKSSAAARLGDGQDVAVEMWPEGPQVDALSADIAAAFEARPAARASFEALAQFYRKGWLRWIDATKHRPDLRVERIAEMVRLLEAGHKQRP